MRDQQRPDRSRGVAPALTYVLAIGISTLLISGLLIGTTAFVEDERRSVVREELEIVGERLAADVEAADGLGRDGANASQLTDVPESVAGAPYYVDVVDCPAGNACLELTSADPAIDTSATVPVNNRSAVAVERAGPRSIRVEATRGPDPSPTADADRRIAANVGIAANATAAGTTGTQVFEENSAPVVSGIRYMPARPAAGETIAYEADVATPIEGNYTYNWDFNDDGTVDVTQTANESTTPPPVTKAYSNPGRYTVTLTVEGPTNRSDSVSRLVRVSGLRLVNPGTGPTATDVDGEGAAAGLGFELENNFPSQDVTITDVEIDPDDDSVTGVHNPRPSPFGSAPEISIDGDTAHNQNVTVYENGTLVELQFDADVAVNEQVSVTTGEFYAGSLDDRSNQFATTGESFDIAVRYETSNRRNYVSTFVVAPGFPGAVPQAPTIDDITVTCDAADFKSTTVTASDPNDDLDRSRFLLYDQNDNLVGAGDISYPPDGGTKTVGGSANTRRIVVKAYDDDGRVTTRDRDVCGP